MGGCGEHQDAVILPGDADRQVSLLLGFLVVNVNGATGEISDCNLSRDVLAE